MNAWMNVCLYVWLVGVQYLCCMPRRENSRQKGLRVSAQTHSWGECWDRRDWSCGGRNGAERCAGKALNLVHAIFCKYISAWLYIKCVIFNARVSWLASWYIGAYSETRQYAGEQLILGYAERSIAIQAIPTWQNQQNIQITQISQITQINKSIS